eukprot:1138498-Pelagomonas_calceolata.AAC.2
MHADRWHSPRWHTKGQSCATAAAVAASLSLLISWAAAVHAVSPGWHTKERGYQRAAAGRSIHCKVPIPQVCIQSGERGFERVQGRILDVMAFVPADLEVTLSIVVLLSRLLQHRI